MKKTTLIFVIGIMGFYLLHAQDFVFADTADLNSDNKPEIIKVEITDNSYGFRLAIDDREITGHFNDGDADGFKVIDISKYDKFKEIAVHTPGPSDDDEYMIYRYNGKDILFMNHLSRWPTFKGNGIVYVDGWEGFWTCRDKYVLDNDAGKLKHVEQFAYYVGVTIKVKKGFEIYREKELINKVALLSEGSEIELILCDKKDKDYFDCRYLIKSESGLLGWADFRHIGENTEGIHTAD